MTTPSQYTTPQHHSTTSDEQAVVVTSASLMSFPARGYGGNYHDVVASPRDGSSPLGAAAEGQEQWEEYGGGDYTLHDNETALYSQASRGLLLVL